MKSLRPIAALVLSLAATASASAQLILNGSFETPLVPPGFYTNFAGGSTAITGWTVVGVDSAVTSGTFMQSGITFQAQSGNQWLDLAGVTSNSTTSGVTQNVATVIGQAYDLNFYVGSATDGVFFFPATVDLTIDGGARMSYFNPTAPSDRLDWKSFTVPFIATSTTTSLTFFNGSASNNYISPLDNVSLAPAVPEPSAALFSAIGILVVALRRTRNCRKA